MIQEGLLKRMKMIRFGHSLDRQDFSAIRLGSQNEARIHRFAIHKDGARTAFANFATALRACQTQLVSKHVEECRVGSDFQAKLTGVNGYMNRRRFQIILWLKMNRKGRESRRDGFARRRKDRKGKDELFS